MYYILYMYIYIFCIYVISKKQFQAQDPQHPGLTSAYWRRTVNTIEHDEVGWCKPRFFGGLYPSTTKNNNFHSSCLAKEVPPLIELLFEATFYRRCYEDNPASMSNGYRLKIHDFAMHNASKSSKKYVTKMCGPTCRWVPFDYPFEPITPPLGTTKALRCKGWKQWRPGLTVTPPLTKQNSQIHTILDGGNSQVFETGMT